MIPALGERKEIYENLAQQLHTYKVVCFDLPGHQQYKVENFTIQHYIENLHQELIKLGIEKAHFMGNSIGAWIIQGFYAMYAHFVASLWLLDGGYFFEEHDGGEPIVLPTTDCYADILEAVEALSADVVNHHFFKHYFLHNFVEKQGLYMHHADEKIVNALAKEVDTINYCVNTFDVPIFLCLADQSYKEETNKIRVAAFEWKHQVKATIIANSQHLLPLTNSDDLVKLVNDNL